MRVSDRPKASLTHSTGLVVKARNPCLSCVLDAQKYSDIKKLIRVTALALRFLHNPRLKTVGTRAVEPLSTDEYKVAEILWFREIQEKVVRSPTFESLKQQLGLYTDDNGLLRCTGRLQNGCVRQRQDIQVCGKTLIGSV